MRQSITCYRLKVPCFTVSPLELRVRSSSYFQNKSSGLVRTDIRDKNLDPSRERSSSWSSPNTPNNQKYVLNGERCILVIYILTLLVISLSGVANQFEVTSYISESQFIGLLSNYFVSIVVMK